MNEFDPLKAISSFLYPAKLRQSLRMSFLRFALFLGSVLLCVGLFSAILFSFFYWQINNLKTLVLEELEEVIGFSFSYESIDPHFLSRFKIHNACLFDKHENQEEPIISFSSLEVTLNIWSVLGLNKEFLIQKINIDDLDIHVDLGHLKEKIGKSKLFEFLSAKERSSNDSSLLESLQNTHNFSLYLSNVRMSVSIPRIGSFKLFTDNISLVFVNDRWDVSGFLRLAIEKTYLPFITGLRSSFNIKGFGKLDPWQLQLIIGVQDFSSKSFQVVDQSYALSLNSEFLRILNTTGDNFSLDVLYEFEPDELKATFSAHEWSLVHLLRMGEVSNNNSLKDLLASTLEADALIEYVNGELSYFLRARTTLGERFAKSLQGELVIDVKGNENWLNVAELNFKNDSGGEFSYQGDYSLVDFFPRGKFNLKNFIWKGNQPISGEILTGETPGKGYFVQSGALSLGEFPVSNLQIVLANDYEKLKFTGLVLFPSKSKQVSQIEIKGSYPFKEILSLDISLLNFPLEDVHLLLPPFMVTQAEALQTLTRGLNSNAHISGDFDLLRPEHSLLKECKFSAYVVRKPHQGLFVKACGEKSELKIQQCELITELLSLSCIGSLHLESQRFFSSHLDVNFNHQKRFPLHLDWDWKEKNLAISSQKNLSFSLDYAKALDGVLVMKDFDLPWKEATLSFNQKLSLKAERGQDWLVDWEQCEVQARNCPFVSSWFLSFQALVTRDILTVENIFLRDSLSCFKGGGVIQDWLSRARASFFLSSDNAKESLQLVWQADHQDFSLDFLGEGLQVQHFKEPKLPIEEGFVDLGISFLKQAGKNPVSSLNFRLKDAYWGEIPVKAHSSLAFLQDHIISSTSQFQVGDKLLKLDNLNIDMRQGTYSFKAYLQQENTKNTRVNNLSRWQGTGKWFSDEGTNNFKASILIDRIEQKLLKGKSLDFTISKEGEIYSVISRDGVSLKGFYNKGTGRLSFVSGDPYPLKVRAEGFLLPDLIDLRIEKLSLEVSSLPLNIFIPGVFTWRTGLISGNLFIRGSLTQPSFSGRLSVCGAKVSTPYVGSLSLDGSPNERIIGPFEAVVLASENLIYLLGPSLSTPVIENTDLEDLPAIETQIERDKVAVRGLFTLEGWELDNFQLQVKTLSNRRGIPVAFCQAGIRAQGYALGAFFLKTATEQLDLKGDFTLNQVDVTLAEEKRKKTARVKKQNMGVNADFNVNLGRSVRFLWPSEVLPLFKAVAEVNQKLHLVVDSSKDDFSLKGVVRIRGGSLTYYSSSFSLTKGCITFNENQDNFNPYVEVQAETNFLDNSTNRSNSKVSSSIFNSPTSQNVRIFLTVNSLLSEMLENVTLSSNPPRSEQEIRVMLGIGDISFDKIEKAQDLGEAGLNLASGLVTNVIFKPIEDFFRNSLNLDYFSLSSDWLKKLSTRWLSTGSNPDKELGDNTPKLDETLSTNRDSALETLAEVLDNTRITAGKYIADGVFFEGGFTLSRGRETYKGRPVKASVDFGFELNASPLVVGWQAGIDLVTLGNLDSFSNQISVGWSFRY